MTVDQSKAKRNICAKDVAAKDEESNNLDLEKSWFEYNSLLLANETVSCFFFSF